MSDVQVAPSRPTAKARRASRPGTLGGDLRVAVMRLSRRLRSQRGDADLSEGQFSLLTTLRCKGEMSPSALAESEHVRPPSMTRALNNLEGLGLVEKVGHPSDRRQVVVRLTDVGRAEITETKRRRDAWLTQQLSQLTPEERETLARASELLNRIASR